MTKNICCTKSESTVNHSSVTSEFKKFHLNCKKLHNQARLDKSKTVDSKAVLHAIVANSVSNTCRVSGESSIIISAEPSRAAELCSTLPKYYNTFDSP